MFSNDGGKNAGWNDWDDGTIMQTNSLYSPLFYFTNNQLTSLLKPEH
jgi:hypothetical protein